MLTDVDVLESALSDLRQSACGDTYNIAFLPGGVNESSCVLHGSRNRKCLCHRKRREALRIVRVSGQRF